MSVETLRVLDSTINPEYVEMLTMLLLLIRDLLLINFLYLAGAEFYGRMRGYPGLGLEMLEKEINWLINTFFGGERNN